MKTLSIEEFHAMLKAQAVPREHLAFVCPMCGTVQSGAGLRAAGVPPGRVDNYLGFSCIGRWTNAGPPPRAPKKGLAQKGCDWTLGGLLSLHECAVLTEDGKEHPHFLPATAEQARKLMERSTS